MTNVEIRREMGGDALRFYDRGFATPEENLACDEVLLDVCEEGAGGEVLRVWQPHCRFVVLGYTNAAAREVNLPACEAEGVPVHRRTTGGGTIVQMPGCLNYALVLKMGREEALEGIDTTNAYILGRVAGALGTLTGEPVVLQGHTDLCLGHRKFAGNAQRRKSRAVLFHGTMLLHADIPGIERLLPQPSMQPGYRDDRGHRDFLTNLGLDPLPVVEALRAAWEAHEPSHLDIDHRVAALATQKYIRREWIMRV
jgi:lipoate---protein ligase